MHPQLAPKSRCRYWLTQTVSAAVGFFFAATVVAQADGSVAPLPAPLLLSTPSNAAQPARIAPVNAPGGALMNNLHDRMRQIQATDDPVLRQRRADEFLKALQGGMQNLAKNGAAAGK